jgi:hypothetical protein
MAMLNNQMVMFTFPYFSEAYIFLLKLPYSDDLRIRMGKHMKARYVHPKPCNQSVFIPLNRS